MNKLRYRVIFSAARGMLVAVQETARSAGKAAGTTVGAVGVTAAALLALTPAHAQIAADPNAPGNQRPTVLAAPNGVPVVNIVTPSAAGVSRNVYRQFDVNAQGAILNNSRTAVQSQLGGYIGANPWLASGSARVILNEVNSSSPSYLRGYVEVAGPKAEVIIANPSGIQVQGGGFINANRVTLTTGVPQLNVYGGIESYRVSGGSIDVSGSGLDASGTEFAALYARMVSINAGVWGGGELRVVTGANQVSADGAPGVAANVVPMAGSGPTPPIAFDSGALGGMYAQKIWIMGTEAGVGARNAGTIQTGAGDARLMGLGELTVTASGRIENTGTIQAAGAAVITAPTFVNSGTVVAAGTTKIATQGDLANAGGTIEGQRIELASVAGDVNNAGTIRQTSMVGLALAAPTLVNTNGGTIGYEPVADSSGAGAGGGSSAGSSGAGAGTGDAGAGSGTGGSADPGAGAGGTAVTPVAPIAPGLITAAGTIRNDGGRVYAGGPIELQTPNVSNAGGKLEVSSLAVSGPTFSNAGGTLHVANGFSANVASFENSGGQLNAGSLDITTTGDLLNQDGTLASNGNANLQVGGMVKNQRGTISATGALDARVAGAIQNVSGSLLANQAVSIQGRSFDNTLGTVASATAGTSLSVTDALTNSGQISGATDLVARAGSLSNTGSLRAGNDASIVVANTLTNDGSITAGRNVVVSAATLHGGRTGVLGAGIQADGSPGATGDLNVTATGALVAQGSNLAAGQATLQGVSVDLSGSQTGAANIAITATQGDVTTSGATVATAGTLGIRADSQGAQTLVNQGGKLNAGQLDLHASNIANTGGGEIVQTGTGATTIAVSGSLSNAGGRIASNGQDLTLKATTLTNTAGKIEHAGTGALNIQAISLNGANGQITSNGALVAAVTGHFNQDGGTTTAKQITIDAGSLGNRAGTIVQTGTDATRIAVVGGLDNSAQGTIASNGATAITAGSLINQAGSIRTAGTSDLSIRTGGLLDNSAQGEIGAGGNVALGAGSFVNDTGRVTAVSDLTATVVGAASNVGGTLAANGDTSISAASLDSTRGTVAAVQGDLRVTTAGATLNSGGTMQAGGNVALVNGGFENSAGKVFGNALSIDTRGHTLTNAKGTLAATTTVAVSSGALVNDAGLIQSGGAMTVSTSGQFLSNTNAAGYAGGQGGITSAGTLDLATGSLSNAGGYVGSKGALTANTGDFSNIGGGIVFSQSSVAVDTHGATYDNTGGETQAVGDLSVNAGTVRNAGGLLRSGATTTLNAGTILNTGTQGTGQGIEGRNVALNVGNLDNTSGAVRSDVQTTITSGGSVNNTNGLISAGDTLRIVDPNAANPTAKTLGIVNTGGVLTANKTLQLDAATFSADGTVISGKDLSIALTQDIVNNGEVSANGDLTYKTTGNLTNNGKLLAGGTLTAGGNVVENTVNAEMSGADTIIQAGTLNNRGLIDSHGQTRIDAGTVNNIGTGRIYGDAVAIGAGTLNNVAETVGGATSAATIAARSTLDIGSSTINNLDGALIFSAGDMFIGGALDANGYATGKGSVLNNLSASIESLSDMSIAMANVNNLDTHLQVVQETRSEDKTHLTTLDGKSWSKADTRGDPFTGQVWHRNADGSETLVGIGYLDWQITETTTRDVATNVAAARLVAGGNMDIDGHLLNRDSKVTAGGSLTATSVDNRATQGQSSTSYSGMATGYDGAGVAFYPMTPYSDPPKTIDIGSFEYTPNTHATAGYNPGSASGVNGPGGSASQAGGVSGGGGPGAVIEVASAVKGSASAGGSGAGTADAADAHGTAGSTRDTPMVVRTRTPDTRVPSASLFQTKPGAGNYLVETDPRFANYRNWLGSDYLLNAMGFDANSVQKRLGDGFYEQKLIREQVAQLTGYRYLDGYSSDEEQYTALMNAGVTFAQKYHLTPGIALTAEQMAQLTSDIVWLVEQTVTLPDGSTQKVLAPQVYVRVQPGDIDGHGALMSAERTTIKNKPGEGDFTNSGTVAGRQLVSITADNVNNLGGRISGGNVALDARADINVIGGTVDARDSLALVAGNDINVRTTTSSTQGALSSATSIDRIAGLYVSNPNGVLVASAGNDVNVVGGILANTGEGSRTLVNAGRDINLGTVTESSARTSITDSRNFYAESKTQEIGSQIVGGGNVTLSATNDINARAAGVAAKGTLAVIAGNDVNISEGRATNSTGFASHQEKKSTFSKSTSTQVSAESTNTSVGSSFSGANVVVSAGNDIAIRGSNVTAQDQLSLSAGRDVRIESAQDQASGSYYSAASKKGFSASFESGIGYSSGSGNHMQAGSSTTQVGSTVSGGNVSIDAGRDVQVIASNVLADKSIALSAGRNIDILAAQDTQSSSSAGSSQNKGVGIVPGLAPRQTAYSNVRGSENGTGESSTAVTSLLSANGGNLTMVAGLDSKYAGTGQGNITTEGADLLAKNKVTLSGNAVNLNAATSTGQSTHSAESKSHTIGAALSGTVGSVITRAYDMAKEAEHTEDSRLKGALELKAGYDAYKLATDGALQNGIQGLGAAGTNGDPAGSAFGVSISEQRSKQRSMSAEAFTQQRGTNIQAGSIDITARETDINMQGAKLQAQDISLDAKRDINLLAAQNTAATASNSSGRSMGGGVTFGFGSQNGISFQGNIGSNQGKANGSEVRYDNTLVTATGSLKLKSGNDTNLKGAQLAGESVKLDVGGNLNIESLQDQTNYASKQTSSGLDVSICVPPICFGEFVTATANYSKQKVDHNYQSATGQSGIAAGDGGFDVTVKGNTDLKGGAITSTATEDKNSFTTGSLTTSDLENRQNTNSSSQSLSLSYSSGGNAYTQGTSLGANAARSASNTALSNLNGGKGLPGNNSQSSQTQSVISPGNIKITGTGNKEIDDKSNANVATLTSRDAETANGALVNTLTLQQAKEIPRLQQEAQDRQRAAQLVGSVVDNVIGDVSAKAGWPDGSPEKIALHGLAGIVQAKIGDGSALAGAAAGMLNEALLPVMADYLESQGIPRGSAEFASLLTAGSTLVGAAVGAASGDAGMGATVATNATVNNYLKHDEIEKKLVAEQQCSAGNAEACGTVRELDALSAQRDRDLASACASPSSDACRSQQAEVRSAQAEIIRLGLSEASMTAQLERLHTQAQADGTLSTGSKLAGLAAGFAQSTVEGLSAIADGIATLVLAGQGDAASGERLSQFAGNAMKLADPTLLAQVLDAANNAQREQLASAYERGDAYAIGKIGGEVLASLPVGVGSIKGIGSTVKAAEKAVAMGAADAAKFGDLLVDQTHLAELAGKGVKFSPQNVIATGTTSGGKIVFLETGNSRAGLQHIVEGHASDFLNIGVSEAQIPSVVMQAVKEGNIVGYQGVGNGRPIYQTTVNGQPQKIAVTISDNGFIVGANPAGKL